MNQPETSSNTDKPSADKVGITWSDTLEWCGKAGPVFGFGLLVHYCATQGVPLRGEWDELLAVFVQWAFVGTVAVFAWMMFSFWPGIAVRMVRGVEASNWTDEERKAAFGRASLTFAVMSGALFFVIFMPWMMERVRWFTALAVWRAGCGALTVTTVCLLMLLGTLMLLGRRLRKWGEHGRWVLVVALVAGTAWLLWEEWRGGRPIPEFLVTLTAAAGDFGLICLIAVGVPAWVVQKRVQRLSVSFQDFLALLSGGMVFQGVFLGWLLLRADLLESDPFVLLPFFMLGVAANGYLSVTGTGGSEELQKLKRHLAGAELGLVLLGVVLVLAVSLSPLVKVCANLTRTGNYELSELRLTREAAERLEATKLLGGQGIGSSRVLKNVYVIWNLGDLWIVQAPVGGKPAVRLRFKEDELESPSTSMWPSRQP